MGKNTAPEWALERLSQMARIHPSWRDFQIREGLIITPSGEEINKIQIANNLLLRPIAHKVDFLTHLHTKPTPYLPGL